MNRVAKVDPYIDRVVRYLQERHAERDARMNIMRLLRAGKLDAVDPAAFNDLFPKPVVSNFIASAAEDFSNNVGQLPALNCASGSMKTEADKKRADLKNKIGNTYWIDSRIEKGMFQGADWYDTFGFLPLYVEPRPDTKVPHIHIENPVGAYYHRNRYGRVTCYAKDRKSVV